MALYMSTAPGEFDPLHESLMAYLTQRFVAYSDTKKAAEIAEAQEAAYRQGFATSLAAFINERRFSFFEKLALEEEMIPQLHPSWVSNELKKLKAAYQNKDRSYTAADFWANECQSFVLGLLATDDIMELETLRHRKAVLAGKEEPRSSDEKWLTEEAERQAAEAKALREAADEAERAAAFLAKKAPAKADLPADEVK